MFFMLLVFNLLTVAHTFSAIQHPTFTFPKKCFICFNESSIKMIKKCSFKLSAKVSLMLDNTFQVPSYCKLNNISVCFIQISTKSSANNLFPSGKAMFFFEVIPSVLGHSVNFYIT